LLNWDLVYGPLLTAIGSLVAIHAASPSWRWLPWSVAAWGVGLTLRHYWRRHRLPIASVVEVQRGPLAWVEVAGPDDSRSTELRLGGGRNLSYPFGWPRPVDTPDTTLELRVDDGLVVRHLHMSIDEQERLFPPEHMGHHLWMTMVGAILVGTTWLLDTALDADQAQATLTRLAWLVVGLVAWHLPNLRAKLKRDRARMAAIERHWLGQLNRDVPGRPRRSR
jgi:hypothetical protein